MALSETGPVDTAGEGEVGRSERGTDTHTCDGELGGGGGCTAHSGSLAGTWVGLSSRVVDSHACKSTCVGARSHVQPWPGGSF